MYWLGIAGGGLASRFNYYGDETRSDLKFEVLIYGGICEVINNALKYAGVSRIYELRIMGIDNFQLSTFNSSA